MKKNNKPHESSACLESKIGIQSNYSRGNIPIKLSALKLVF
jgi:hypothetical protein